MTTPAYNAASVAANRQMGLFGALNDILGKARGQTPPPAPAANSDWFGVGNLLDNYNRSANPTSTDPVAQAALSRLQSPGAMTLVDGAGWTAIGRLWRNADAATKASLTQQLGVTGVQVQASEDGRYVTFRDATNTITVEPATDRVRAQRASYVECYDQGTLVQTMSYDNTGITVETAYGTEHWTLGGEGTFNGQPITPRPAPWAAGEQPRNAIAYAWRNDLEEPLWTGQADMKSYGDEYDEAIIEAGGRVLQPSESEADADVYNCHSYATTGGEGDLFDPFMRNGQPHWLDNPMRQLLVGGYGQLAPDQRAQPGDVVVYRKDGVITHTGVVDQVDAGGNPLMIDSKFGVLGLYLHELDDVSDMYGSPSEIYRPPSA